MAFDVWPISLPQDFLLSGYSYAMGDGRLRSNMDTGPAKLRLRTANMPSSITGNMILNASQVRTLEQFVNVTTLGGTISFQIRDPQLYQLSGHRALVRFVDLPGWNPITPNLFQVSIKLEKMDTLPPPAPAFSTDAITPAREGVAYRWTPTVIEGTKPYRGFNIVAGSLPAGLAMDTTTGTITGVPPLAGTYNFTIQVTDDDGRTATRAVTLTVRNRAWIHGGERGSRVAIDPVLTRNSTATYFGIDGLLKIAPANQPRFDYEPVNSRFNGVLIEEARTNVIVGGSLPGSGSGWNVTNSTRTVVAGAGIDGGDAVQITEGSNTGEHRIGYTVTAFPENSTTDFWHTALVKLGTGSAKRWIYAWCGTFANHSIRSNAYFNLATGEVGTVGGSGDFDARINSVGNGWYRIALKGQTLNTTNGNVGLWINIVSANGEPTAQEVGDGYSSILTQYWQSEVGAFPTSIIPTTTAAATRAADQYVIPNGWQGNYFSPFASTVVAKFRTFDTVNTRRLVDRSGGNNGVILQVNAVTAGATSGVATGQIVNAGGFVADNELPNVGRTIPAKVAYAFDMSTASIAVNGREPRTVSRANPTPAGTANDINIGWSTILGNGGQLNGWIESVQFIPRRVSDEELRELSSL
ncbi:Ig domain-containing protein [Aureimonas altamirensis]|uniref:Ig domain-containing protein n=1 Tax=Aureimonas altamirensis TaxID=370622 RepID=UPI002036F4DC|nr:Ig domain-containing protein [Aureimonas altamirensis]MCM2506061.1 Ig domain-containing protein [Aureimonas altamirensis]